MCELWVRDGSGEYSCFATDVCGPEQSLFIHIAHPGEKIFMGFRSTEHNSVAFKIKLNGVTLTTMNMNQISGVPGYIEYHSQAVAGPNILDPHGYNPLTFVPTVAGDYCISFTLPADGDILLKLADFTVIDTTISPLVPIEGRLWSQDWSFQSNSPFMGTMDVLTSDSIVTSVSFNSMQGMLFDVTSTRNGCFPPPALWDTSCLSRKYNRHYAEYKIFVNNPDSTEYPTGTFGSILGDTVNVARGCDGSFTFKFVVNKPGKVQLNIEPNLVPGIQDEDLVLTRSVLPGLISTIFWDGRNALGDPVPCGDSVALAINYINGLTNLALFDVEQQAYGFIIQPVRPPGQPIATYWNDTLLDQYGGQAQLTGCSFTPPDEGCHVWLNSSNLGEGHTINTWWYAASSILNLGRFKVDCIPHTPQDITGPLSVCSSENSVYTVVPDPLPGSEPLGYEWEMTDATSGAILLDSIDTGSSVQIDFSAYPPGQKRLKVRGRSDLCGNGPYGTGILITVTAAPTVTNPVTFFSMCSGDTTNILLESSMAGTTFSFTTEATTPLITGQSSGNGNLISQVLQNTGNTLDSVLYYVVPFLSPCNGDTVVFVVVVNPTDSLVITLSATANPACEGMPVTCFVPPLVGGPSTDFGWLLNGFNAGTNTNEFTFVPVNGDRVKCVLYSPLFCTPGSLASTDELVIDVIPKVPVNVTVTPSANPVCEGDPVTITASSLNGGTSPAWQWWINGINSGSADSVYTYNPANGDEVICILASNHYCIMDSVVMDTVMMTAIGELKVVDTILCYGITYFAAGRLADHERDLL